MARLTVQRGLTLLPSVPRWGLEAFQGRLVELSGGAVLTAAFELVAEAFHGHELVAWVGSDHRPFYPPDAHRAGVPVEEMVVVLLDDPRAAARASVRLLASGGFGLVVFDAPSFPSRAVYSSAVMSRWVALSRKHQTAVVVVTDKKAEESSIGSLVSFRAEVRALQTPGEIAIDVLKDKRHGPGAQQKRHCRLPDGLRGDFDFRASGAVAASARVERLPRRSGGRSKTDRSPSSA